MIKKIPVKEVTNNRFIQTEPIWTEKTENGFLCPKCKDEVVITYIDLPDGTRRADIPVQCKNCDKKWDIIKTNKQITPM